jgi:uncharacterized protein (DUF736 family)
MGRCSHDSGSNDVAQIGTFRKNGDGSYTGEIVTLSVQAKNVRITPEFSQTAEDAPSHLVTVGRAEIGAGWKMQTDDGSEYLVVKLDDPSFDAPIHARLFDSAGCRSASLVWLRENRVA